MANACCLGCLDKNEQKKTSVGLQIPVTQRIKNGSMEELAPKAEGGEIGSPKAARNCWEGWLKFWQKYQREREREIWVELGQ